MLASAGTQNHGRFLSRFIAILLLLGCVVTAHAQVAVVDPRITEPIDRHRLQQILLGQITTWADGSPIVIVLANDSASRAACEEISGRDLDRLLRGWKRLVFTGGGAMPTVVDSAQQAQIKVGSQAGAIAVLDKAPVDSATPHVRTIILAK